MAKTRQDQAAPFERDHTVMVLQGGGALRAYQAGVYAGLAEAGAAPDWIVGVSISANKMPR